MARMLFLSVASIVVPRHRSVHSRGQRSFAIACPQKPCTCMLTKSSERCSHLARKASARSQDLLFLRSGLIGRMGTTFSLRMLFFRSRSLSPAVWKFLFETTLAQSRDTLNLLKMRGPAEGTWAQYATQRRDLAGRFSVAEGMETQMFSLYLFPLYAITKLFVGHDALAMRFAGHIGTTIATWIDPRCRPRSGATSAYCEIRAPM